MEKPRSKPQEPKAPATQQPEFSKKAHQEKKKNRRNWRQHEGSTPATRITAAKPGEPSQKKKNKNWNHLDRTPCDFSTIKYYTCQKMDHYSNDCLEQKN